MSQLTESQPRERVVLGLLASLGAVVGGIVVAVLLWRLGFIAGISSFVIAIGGAYLYTAAAGRTPRAGLVPLVVVIVVGVVISFFAIVASDLVDAYDQLFSGALSGPGKVTFVKDNLFNGDVLATYKKDGAFFALFAALGIGGTIRRLLASR